jgi:hypothetical protein
MPKTFWTRAWIAAAILATVLFLHEAKVQPRPRETQESVSNASWQLSTDDTRMTIGIVSNRPAILRLANPARGWNWTPAPAAFSLLGRVTVNNATVIPDWTYRDATVAESNGRKLTLRFTSTRPKLELDSVWTARKGAGPVEEQMTLKNQTGGPLTINAADVESANMPFVADRAVTLWRFSKTPREGIADAHGRRKTDVGVFIKQLGPNTLIHSVFGRYGILTLDRELPFEMFDVGSRHGLYIGYTFGYGLSTATTDHNPLRITTRFYLNDVESIKVDKNVDLEVPGIFIGAYKGDTDDGSNRMKRWFRTYKLPPFLKNPDEPLIELCASSDCDGDVNKLMAFLKANDFASWGVGIFKVDIFYAQATPPYARIAELADLVHSRHLKFSVWQTNFVPEAQLLDRYDQWHYDYYRSDGASVHPSDYWGYVNFWKKLDDLAAARPGFRWENCCYGGSLKSFDDCERMAFMTTTDTPTPLDFKKALYPNSYMINPLQLKSDCLCRDTFDLRCTMMGAILTGIPKEMHCDEGDVKKSFFLYNTKQVPILRGADVYHILPMPDGKNWDGLEYFNPSLNKGSVFLFKPTEMGGASRVIKLKGLDRNATYAVTFQDRPEQNARKTGADLMDSGLPVSLPGSHVSEIIWIEAIMLAADAKRSRGDVPICPGNQSLRCDSGSLPEPPAWSAPGS